MIGGGRGAGGPSATCDVFDANADELALGLVDEPLRTSLLAHAAGCASCRSLLDELAAVGDNLLLAAPEMEPPAGFESRVLERLPSATGSGPGRPGAAPAATGARPRRWLAAAVAAAVVLLAGTVAAVAVAERRGPTGEVAGPILTASGQEVGEIRLLRDPVPHLLITVPNPQGAPGVRFCELQRADGSWVRVGSWEVADIASGVWAAGIESSLLDATAMRVVTDQGVVLATAALR